MTSKGPKTPEDIRREMTDRASPPERDRAALGRLFARLVKAIHACDMGTVSQLLSKDLLCFQKRPGGWTALHYAADCDSPDILELLLDCGADPNIKNSEAMTPIFFAVTRPESVKRLLRHGADVSVKGPDGDTPLHWACTWGSVESVGLLIDGGAKVDAINRLGVPPIYNACMPGKVDVIRRMVEGGARPDERFRNGATLLQRAIEIDDYDILTYLWGIGCTE